MGKRKLKAVKNPHFFAFFFCDITYFYFVVISSLCFLIPFNLTASLIGRKTTWMKSDLNEPNSVWMGSGISINFLSCLKRRKTKQTVKCRQELSINSQERQQVDDSERWLSWALVDEREKGRKRNWQSRGVVEDASKGGDKDEEWRNAMNNLWSSWAHQLEVKWLLVAAMVGCECENTQATTGNGWRWIKKERWNINKFSPSSRRKVS